MAQAKGCKPRQRQRQRQKQEPLSLSRERICREALALVDEEGLEALSMRRLGARLGVEAMSLYRHVRDKRDLLDALHAAVLGDLQPAGEPGGEGWRAILGGLSRALRSTLLLHPNVVALFATRPVTAPEAVGTLEIVWAALEQAGFSPGDARKAVVAVGVLTLGHVLGEAHGEAAPQLGMDLPGVAEFDFGLEALLDGIALRRKSHVS